MISRKCKNCEKEFMTYRCKKKTFCSMLCRSQIHNTRKDLTGKIFGRLSVLGISHIKKYESCSSLVYLVKCSCGAEKSVEGKNLSSGKIVSCGCKHKEESFGKACVNTLYSEYKHGAMRRDLPFNISREYFSEMALSDCYYCGESPKLRSDSRKNKMNGRVPLNGIDRVDNSLGYTEENSVPCCKNCNFMKLKMSEKDFVNHAEKIAEFQKQKGKEFPASYLTVIA